VDIYETILDACWKHYWDSMEDDKTIIIDHIEGILEFVKTAQQKMHPTLLESVPIINDDGELVGTESVEIEPPQSG
jgi:hypothetical protein